MSNMDLIRELRNLTQAGMKDCKDALEESGWDLDKAVDIVKTKGQNITSGRQGRVASEGVVQGIVNESGTLGVLVEVNCQTDFTARNDAFLNFVRTVAMKFFMSVEDGEIFNANDPVLEELRSQVVSTTKENVVVRRWFAEQSVNDGVKTFAYVHSNKQIGVLLTLAATSSEAASSPEFKSLGNDLAMQVAAMSPLAVSSEKLDPQDVTRQTEIFYTQLREANKPEATWPKIVTGKTNKWYSEVCLLNQESVVVPKKSVSDVVSSVAKQLNTEITVVNFVRCQVGEGVEKIEREDLQAAVAEAMAGK